MWQPCMKVWDTYARIPVAVEVQSSANMCASRKCKWLTGVLEVTEGQSEFCLSASGVYSVLNLYFKGSPTFKVMRPVALKDIQKCRGTRPSMCHALTSTHSKL